MPEVPEIASRAREMDNALPGKTIQSIKVLQPKCLNISPEEFQTSLVGAKIFSVGYHGKWIQIQTDQGWLLLNLGMGGEILLVTNATLPPKYRIIFNFYDQTCLAVNFWWFGYAHFTQSLSDHPASQKLGPNVLDMSLEEFHKQIAGQKTSVKTFLLDQSRIAGIGNAYVHDILFLAKVHPQRKTNSLTETEIDALYNGVQKGLRPSLEKGGAFYETDLFGQKGGFTIENILIGYRENQPCPICLTPIQKIKTGSTSSFICPTCQPL